MKRREFIKNTGLALTLPSLFLRAGGAAVKAKKMLILGFDGMDPGIVMDMIKRGELPHIRRFAEIGSMTQMISTAPPESPVAWASFATGLDPAGHGIFGFLGRKAENYMPFSNASPVVTSAGKNVTIGDWKIPITGGDSHLNREGTPFWDYLMARDIDCTIYKMPSNYPPSEMKRGRAIAGMGTPDVLGSNGIFTLYTSDEQEAMKESSGKGIFNLAYFDDYGVMEGEIEGPRNVFRQEPEPVMIPFKVFRDRVHRTARIDIQGQEILLQEGQMSDWVRLDFTLIPLLQDVKAITRFYLLDNQGDKFRLYIYPPSIDPGDPAQVISSPESYSRELAGQAGPFYTLGLPADFNAIKDETFSMENYIVQSHSVFQESLKIFDYEFGRFLGKPEAMLFYYFSAIDQGSHIYWALRDPLHPYYHAEEAKRFGDQIEAMYREFDQIVGQVVKRLPAGIPLMILSDHGFAPLRRQLNLNALLHQNGFLKVVGQPDYSDSFMLLKQANWDNTQAYALGLNGLFINLRSREGNGIVRPEDKRKVMENIKNLLLSLKDPKTGENAVGKVFFPEDIYKGRFLDRGPDMIVGCNRGYGLDYLCATGGMSREIITDNLNRWSGDHIIDPHQVPAILMTNFKITDKRVPAIWDMAPTILDVFGIPTPTPMRGKSLI